MQKAIIGKKVGMTQIFDESGTVTQLKTVEKDGYAAVQLGYQDVKESKLTKPEAGHLKKANVALKKVGIYIDEVTKYGKDIFHK